MIRIGKYYYKNLWALIEVIIFRKPKLKLTKFKGMKKTIIIEGLEGNSESAKWVFRLQAILYLVGCFVVIKNSNFSKENGTTVKDLVDHIRIE